MVGLMMVKVVKKQQRVVFCGQVCSVAESSKLLLTRT